MSYVVRLLVVVCVITAAWASWTAMPLKAKEDKAPPAKTDGADKPGAKKLAMKAFMRKKLAASQDVMEGLALEDFDLIAKGAKQLQGTSAAAEFMVVNDPIYKEHADDFRRIVAKLDRAAREKRVEGATLAFMDLTMTCVECHKYTRTILVAQK